MDSRTGPERVIFVGGAPRSGTTLTYALLCTADEVGDYDREISFYRGIVQMWEIGHAMWDLHTYAYFASIEDFRLFVRDLSNQALQRIWAAAGRPKVLCVKEPTLTPKFPVVALLYEGDASVRFVTVARAPEDVIRSRMDVYERGNGEGAFTKGMALDLAREYLEVYQPLLTSTPAFAGRHLSFRYDQINRDIVLKALADHLGVEALHPDRLWRDLKPMDPDDPWASGKFGDAIDTAPRHAPLPADWVSEIRQITEPVVATYRFPPPVLAPPVLPS